MFTFFVCFDPSIFLAQLFVPQFKGEKKNQRITPMQIGAHPKAPPTFKKYLVLSSKTQGNGLKKIVFYNENETTRMNAQFPQQKE